MRVKKGSILVRLDKEPYQVKLAIKNAAVAAAEADLTATQAKVPRTVGLVRAHRFQLEHAIEDVNTRVAELRADVATYMSRKASLELRAATWSEVTNCFQAAESARKSSTPGAKP